MKLPKRVKNYLIAMNEDKKFKNLLAEAEEALKIVSQNRLLKPFLFGDAEKRVLSLKEKSSNATRRHEKAYNELCPAEAFEDRKLLDEILECLDQGVNYYSKS